MSVKISRRSIAVVMFAVALAGLAVMFYKPPFWFAMTFYAVSITVFATGLVLAVADAIRTK